MNTSDITKLATERRNPRSRDIDRLTTAEMVSLINSEDKKVADAVEKVCPQIAAAIDLIYARMKRGGRLIYCGCGTSGRLGILDASECPPTYSVPPEVRAKACMIPFCSCTVVTTPDRGWGGLAGSSRLK